MPCCTGMGPAGVRIVCTGTTIADDAVYPDGAFTHTAADLTLLVNAADFSGFFDELRSLVRRVLDALLWLDRGVVPHLSIGATDGPRDAGTLPGTATAAADKYSFTPCRPLSG